MKLFVLPTLFVFGALACAPQTGSEPEPAEAAESETPAMPSAQQFSEDSDLRALRETVALFAQTYGEEDLDGFMDLFTDDVVRLPPEAPEIKGTDAVRANMYNQFENADSQITIHMEESEFSGDMAFVRGTFAVTGTTADGESTDLIGSWMNLMRRGADGKWRIARNIWNRDQPDT